MTRLVLVFTLISSAFAAPPHSLDEEREALSDLAAQFSQFEIAVDDADQAFAKLRRAYEAHRRKDAEAVAETLAPLIRRACREWVKVEDLFYKYRLEGLDIANPVLRADFSESLGDYLGIKRNGRYGNGASIEFLLRTWRGLQTGDKIVFPPSNVRRRNEIEGVRIPAYESILVMTTRGGFIRGRVEGMANDKLILRELLPGAFMRYNKQGLYRALPLDQIATIEIVKRPPTIARQELPMPAVNPEGDYADYYVRPGFVTRIEYRPDDFDLYELVRNGQWHDWDDSPVVTPVNLETETRPAYSTLFFFDCNERLRTRVVKFPKR